MEQLKENTSISREYGQFISQFDWRYFMTCRYRYKLSEKTVRKWTDKLFKAYLSISRIYWVLELDTEDNQNLTTNTKEVAVESGTIYYWSVTTSDGNISVTSDVFSFRVN